MRKNTRGSLIWLRMMRFTHQSNLLSNEFLKQYDLTTAQFDVLNQISTNEPLTQSELAEKVTVTQGGISRMLLVWSRIDSLTVNRNGKQKQFL